MKKRLQIPIEGRKYYCKYWLELYDGGSGTWLYVVRDSLAYIFIEIMDMIEFCGDDAQNWFNAGVAVVDLLSIDIEEVGSAIRTVGGEPEDFDFKTERGRLNMAIACFEHGAKARMWQDEALPVTKKNRWDNPDERHPAFRKLRAEARQWVEESLFNEDKRNRLLDDTIVNKIGQSARSYMIGTKGLWDTLRQIKNAGDEATPAQQLMLRMYQSAGQTLGAGPVPTDLMEKEVKP